MSSIDSAIIVAYQALHASFLPLSSHVQQNSNLLPSKNKLQSRSKKINKRFKYKTQRIGLKPSPNSKTNFRYLQHILLISRHRDYYIIKNNRFELIESSRISSPSWRVVIRVCFYAHSKKSFHLDNGRKYMSICVIRWSFVK